MGTRKTDVLVNWKDEVLRKAKNEELNLILRYLEHECIVLDMEDLRTHIADEFEKSVVDNPTLDFADMMLRMQRALLNQYQQQVKTADPTLPPKDQFIRNIFEADGLDWDSYKEEIYSVIDKNITVEGTELLNVIKATQLFQIGELNAYVEEAEARANNLQRELILSLESLYTDTDSVNEETSNVVTRSRPPSSRITAMKRQHGDVAVPSHSPPKRPSIPQLHPLSSNIRKRTILSPRAQAIPNPSASMMAANSDMDVSNGRIQVINSAGRKVSVAVRKNPVNSSFERRPSSQPSVPQRVSIRAATSTDSQSQSMLKVVSVESLQKSPFKLQVNHLGPASSKGTIPVTLPPSITVIPAQPDKQGVLYPKQKTPPVLQPAGQATGVPPFRPASARKSPHKSTMYTNATHVSPIKPKAPEVVTSMMMPMPQFKYIPIQPRLSVGQSMTMMDSEDVNMDDGSAEEGIPQIIGTEGGVTTFISKKLNAFSREGQKINANASEQQKSPSKPTIDGKGSWLLGCPTCGVTYPLLCDNKYRQHLMIEHSIEVDDNEIQAVKFFSKTMYRCRKCTSVFFKNREDHHKKCSPLIRIDDAFVEVPFTNKNPELIKCGICNIMCDTRINLRQHLERHHKEVVNCTLVDPKYRCSRCLKAFVDSMTLTSHVAICRATHSEKSSILEIARSLLSCDVCQKTHNKISEVQLCYAGKKLIRCMLCLYTCISRQNFSRHMVNFHRRDNVGIACPFCPHSQVAAVRAQFEHIVSHHYNAAIDEDELRKANAAKLPPVPAPKGRPRVINVNQSNLFKEAHVFQANAAGNLVISSGSPGTLLRPMNPNNARPLVMGTRPGGVGGNIRFMVAPNRQVGNNEQKPHILKGVPPGTPIIVTTSMTNATQNVSVTIAQTPGTTPTKTYSTVNSTNTSTPITISKTALLKEAQVFGGANSVGKLVLSPGSTSALLRTMNISNVRPMVMGTRPGGVPGNIRFMITPNRQTGNDQQRQQILKGGLPGTPISVTTASLNISGTTTTQTTPGSATNTTTTVTRLVATPKPNAVNSTNMSTPINISKSTLFKEGQVIQANAVGKLLLSPGSPGTLLRTMGLGSNSVHPLIKTIPVTTTASKIVSMTTTIPKTTLVTITTPKTAPVTTTTPKTVPVTVNTTPKTAPVTTTTPNTTPVATTTPKTAPVTTTTPKTAPVTTTTLNTATVTTNTPNTSLVTTTIPKMTPVTNTTPNTAPVTTTTPNTAPVTTTNPKTAPVTSTTPKTAPVTTTTPKTGPVTTTTPKTAPVTTTTPKTTPVATTTTTTAPVTTTTPSTAPVTTTTLKTASVTNSTYKTAPVTTSTPNTAPVTTTTLKTAPVTNSIPKTAPVASTTPNTTPVTTTATPKTAPVTTTTTPKAASVATTNTPKAAPVATTATPKTAPVTTTTTPKAAPVTTTNTPKAAPVATTATPKTAPLTTTTTPKTALLTTTTTPKTAPVTATTVTTTPKIAQVTSTLKTYTINSTKSSTPIPNRHTGIDEKKASGIAIPTIVSTPGVTASPNISGTSTSQTSPATVTTTTKTNTVNSKTTVPFGTFLVTHE